MQIPNFKSTEDAMRFGKTANERQINLMANLRKYGIDKADKLMKLGDLDTAVIWATKAQFYREAIEAKEI